MRARLLAMLWLCSAAAATTSSPDPRGTHDERCDYGNEAGGTEVGERRQGCDQKLNARHLRQVETYAVKEGLEWVILTNGQIWQAYHISAGTGQQVSTTLALEVDLLGDESPSKKTATLFHLHRSAPKRNTIDDLWKRQTATAPAALASVLTADTVLDAIRKEIRRGSGFNADPADIATTLTRSVIRGELLSTST